MACSLGLPEVPTATVPASRPDLAAHCQTLRLPIPEIVKQLVGLIGRKLTAYVGGVRDVRAVDAQDLEAALRQPKSIRPCSRADLERPRRPNAARGEDAKRSLVSSGFQSMRAG